MKSTLYPLIIAASLPLMAQTVSAQTTLFSDNYTATSNQTPNDQITNPGRQGGTLAPLGYIQSGNVQIGNTTTLPIDPGDASSGDSFLAAFGGSAYINYDFSVVTGPLEIDFKGLVSHIAGSPTDWVSLNVGNGAGAPFVNNSAVSSILFRANGGIELWNQSSVNDPSGVGFAPGYDAWTSYKVILSDTAGTGSAFVGNGSRADYYSNGSFIGTFNMNQLGTGQGYIGFSAGDIVGYDNVTILGTLPAVIAPALTTDIEPLRSEVTTGMPMTLSVGVTGTPLSYQWYNQSGAISGATTNTYSFNALAGTNYYQVVITNSAGSVTSSIASVISATNIVTVNNYSFENGGTSYYGNGELPTGWLPFNDAGNWAGLGTGPGFSAPDGNYYLAINTIPGASAPSGLYQDVGALLPNTTYTLTVAIGRSTAAGVPPNGVGDWSPGIISLLNGTDSTGALLATTTGYPSVVGTWQDYTATFSTGPAPSGHLVVTLSDAPANTYQATFDNVRLTSVVSSVPLPILLTNTTPASATVAVGGSAVFTAAFSNSPPVSLQWQQIVSGAATNNINTGVVNVTNNGVVTSTLTLNNVQLTGADSYRLEAVNATSSAAVVYTTPALLTVVPTITWHTAGTYNGVFSTDSVLGFAGSVANEVYGVDFGGSGSVTTDNGYTFNDYAGSGNMTIANSAGLTSFVGYEGGSVTTGDGGLDTILNYGVSGAAAHTGTLNNLTVGQAYTVLVLMDDNRTSGASGPSFDVTDGLTTSPVQTFAFPNGVPAVGGFIMGTFTAQSTNQPLTVLANGSAQYIAILLEQGTAAAPIVAPTLTQDVIPLVSQLSPGAPVTLSVVAAGSPPLYYQWSNQNGPISGATNASYTFDAPGGPGSYNTNYYSVSVTNAASGLVSSTAEVITSTNIVSVYNYSFENGTYGGGNLVFPVDWTPFNNNNFSSVSAAGSVYSSLPDGNYFYGINEGPSDPTGGIYQDVGALLPNTTYTLTVAIGLREDFTPGQLGSPGIISLINGTNNTGLVLASTNGIPSTPNTWQDYTASFTTGPSVSGDLTVELSVAGASTYQANFDNVRLTKASGPSVVAPELLQDNVSPSSPIPSRLTTGTPVTYSVVAGGYPLSYQWYNQNGAISGATSTSYSFNSVTGTNTYYVSVTNTLGAVTSSIATVVSAPSIVTVKNYSFQSQVLTPGQSLILTPNGPTGWTGFSVGSGGVGDIGLGYAQGTDFTVPLTAPGSGNNYLWLNRFNGNGTQVIGIYQDLGAMKPNTAYTLTVAIGSRGDRINSPGFISLINGVNNTGTLLATGGGLPVTQNTWQDYTVTYTTGASVSGDLTVELSDLDAATIQADFSDVQVTQVPLFVFNAPSVSGGKLILTATGGTANGGYTLLTTTNLLGPWTTNNTGTFSGTGVFSNSIPIGTNPASFFLLRTP